MSAFLFNVSDHFRQSPILPILLLSLSGAVAQAEPLPNDPPGQSFYTSTPIDFTTLDATTCGCMDVVFLVDDTSSMDAAIENLRIGFQEVLEVARLRADDDLRAGLIRFADDVLVVEALTDDLDAVSNGLQAIVTGGGNEIPEASDEALRAMLGYTECPRAGSPSFDVPFRNQCTRYAFLITDAPPGGCDSLFQEGVDDVNARRRAVEAAGAGIRIFSILVNAPGVGPETHAIMQNYASRTGGEYIPTDEYGANIAQYILPFLDACPDCQPNGYSDTLETAAGSAPDCNSNAIPDECESLMIQCGVVDVVFVLDTSGSMCEEIEALCTVVDSVVGLLADSGLDLDAEILRIADLPPQPGRDAGRSPEYCYDVCEEDSVDNLYGNTALGLGMVMSDCPTEGAQGSIEDWGPASAVVAANL